HLAGEEELQRAAAPDEARESLRAAVPGTEAELHLQLPELRPVRRDADVAGHGELTPAAQREAVHRCDHRTARRLEPAEDSLTAQREGTGARRIGPGEFRDVRPRHERAPRAGEDDPAHVVARVELVHHLAE